MRRFVSIWLPRWPIERRHHGPQPKADGSPDAPLALTAVSRHGHRVTAVDAAAERTGVTVGMPLADARAVSPGLLVEAADPDGDGDALHRLALWCGRYSPWTAVDEMVGDAPDGIVLDITGCAHLFGGEADMLADIAGRLAGFGLTVRLAVAPTLGAAWAVARHGPDSPAIVAGDAIVDALAPLPVAALRLHDATVQAMGRVGLKRIGDVLGKPSAPLTARFGRSLLTRLDQALGRQAETVHGLLPPPRYEARRIFADPIVLTADVERTVAALAGDLATRLDDAGVGARQLDLRLWRVDGRVRVISVRTGALCRYADHIIRLFRERLDGTTEELDTGFGFDLVTLNAMAVEPFTAHQEALEAGEEIAAAPLETVTRLLDRFGNRLGFDRVVRFAPVESAIPERAARRVPVLHAPEVSPGSSRHDWAAHLRTVQGGGQLGRPLLLFAPPEPVTVLAEVPDGPPVRFEWRRVVHRVARADGPERLAPEWWRPGSEAGRYSRDYYRVEDTEGRRFWLFREGLYDRPGDTPRWFLHGHFA